MCMLERPPICSRALTAMLYSLSGPCRLNVEPEKWLRYVIEHIQE